MKANQNFSAIYILLAIAQMVVCNYFRISPYISVTVLPAMVLCIPLKINTMASMLIAFGTGLAVDFLAEGIIGLNTLALVPVALIRQPLLKAIMGDEISDKGNPFNSRSASIWKTLLAVTVVYMVFLSIYILADGSGVRPFWFNAARFAASLACDGILALLVIHVLNPNDR